MGKPKQRKWQTTVLWEALIKRTRVEDAVRNALSLCMNSIEDVLQKGGTAPLNFTLHDSEHAFRVAQIMAKIIPAKTLGNLSVYELALLLLSAYLHDIGMTPENGKVQAHYTFLITGSSITLTEEHKKRFQGWLDDERHSVVPPLCKGIPTSEELVLARELVAYYCRDRHNDWSEEWIRNHLANTQIDHYPGWLDDLIVLCRSHHEGYNDLSRDRFNVRIASGSTSVNLRYLAAVLRIADVLENDPERTPEVILRHRQLEGPSLIHWYKPHDMSILVDTKEVKLSARPRDARIHKGILDTITQINEELQLCKRLADEGRFSVGLATQKVTPEWHLPARVSEDVRPGSDGYVFIDASFRPDTEKLLQLLGGSELYRDPLIAVRELLSNAFDGVREKIAHKRLRQHKPALEDYEKTLGQLESVDLRFEWDQDGAWIVCRDTGVGMSKTIIENYFLVSGRSTRRHLRELQRDCVREGFSFIRSGQFGIGVLSFFMLANKVIIRTRRCQECGEGDTDGWLFETEGIGTFGELRTDDSCEPGTEVRLHLRQDVVGDDPQNWYRQLLEFVKRVLVRIPCVFSLTSSLPNAASFSSQAGWTRSTEDLINLCLESAFTNRPTYRELPLELLPDTEKVRREEERQYFAQLTKDVKANLKFIVSEGSLPDGIGKFRIHIPYFEPEGGLSLVFLRIKTAKKEHELGHVGEARGFALSGYSLFAWRGIQVSRQTRLGQSLSSPYLERSGIMEIDFVSPEAGQIGVDRRTITVLREGTSALWYTRQKRQQSLSNLVASHGRSIYATLNSMHGNVDPPSTMDFYWVKYKTPNRAIWTRFKLPITNSGGWCGHRTSLLMNKIQVTVLPPFPILKKNKRTNWIGVTTPPSMVTYLRTDEMSRPSVVPVWKEPIPSRSSRCPAGRRAQFPSEWSDFCGAKFISGALDTGAIVWNPENRLVKLLNWDTWRWCETTFEKLLDHRPHRDRLLQDPHAGAAWIIHCINAKLSELWDAIRERDPSFLSALWQSISEESGAGSFRVVRLWQEGTPSFDDDEADPDETQVWEITPEGWKVLPMASATELEYHTYLPKPNSAFCLEGSSVKTN